MLRFFVTFIALQVALFAAELTPWAQQYFVVPWTSALATITAVVFAPPSLQATSTVAAMAVNTASVKRW